MDPRKLYKLVCGVRVLRSESLRVGALARLGGLEYGGDDGVKLLFVASRRRPRWVHAGPSSLPSEVTDTTRSG